MTAINEVFHHPDAILDLNKKIVGDDLTLFLSIIGK